MSADTPFQKIISIQKRNLTQLANNKILFKKLFTLHISTSIDIIKLVDDNCCLFEKKLFCTQ